MRRLHTVIWFVWLAVAVIGVTAAPGDAHGESFQAIDPDEGLPCDPCYFEVHGETVVRSDYFGIVLSRCVETYEGLIYEDGTGKVTTYTAGDRGETFTDLSGYIASNPIGALGGVRCERDICDGAGEGPSATEWPIGLPSEEGGERAVLTVGMCLDDASDRSGEGLRCVVPFVFQTEEGFHGDDHGVLSARQDCGLELIESYWETEDKDFDSTHDDLEIVHAG